MATKTALDLYNYRKNQTKKAKNTPTNSSGGKTALDLYNYRKQQKTQVKVPSEVEDLYNRYNALVGSATERYSQSGYHNDSKKWKDVTATATGMLSNSSKEIRGNIDNYKATYGEDFANSVLEMLDGIDKGLVSLNDAAVNDYKVFSKFATEEDYNNAVTALEEEQRLLNYDEDAAKSQLQALNDDLARVNELYDERRYALEAGNKEAVTRVEKELAELSLAPDQPTEQAIQNIVERYRRKISALEGEIELARSTKEVVNWNSINDPNSEYYDPEFDFFSTKGAQLTNTSSDTVYAGDKGVKNPVMFVRNGGKIITENSMGDQKLTDDAKRYLSMSDEEAEVYNYFLGKYGIERAEEYVDWIEKSAYSLTARVAAEEFEKSLKGNRVAEYFHGITTGLDQFGSGIKNLFSDEDYYRPTVTQYKSSFVRDDLQDSGYVFNKDSENGGTSLGQIFYDVTTTTSNMLPSVLVSAAVGKINPEAGGIVGSTLMGASASGNAYAEMINLGYSKGQARTYSLLVGASEATLQYLLGGIDKLGGKVSSGITKSLVSKLDNVLAKVAIRYGDGVVRVLQKGTKAVTGFTVDALSEGLEESLQEVIDPLFKAVALGDYNAEVDWGEVLYSGILGVFTAAGMNSVNAGATGIGKAVQYYGTGKSILKSENAEAIIQRMQKLGSLYSADSVAYKLAGKVDANTGAYTIGKLFYEEGATLSSQNIADLQKSLEEKGLRGEDASTIVEVFDKAVETGRLTEELGELLDGNEDIAKSIVDVLINPNSTINQRRRNYSALMDEINGVSIAAAPQNEKTVSNQATNAENEVAYRNSQTEAVEANFSLSGDAVSLVSTNEEVTLGGVVTENGKNYIKIKDSSGNVQNVSADEVSFANEDEATLYTAFAHNNIDGICFDEYIKGYKESGMGSIEYASAFYAAYEYGLVGVPKSELATDPSVEGLSDYVKSIAYDFGAMAKRKNNVVKESNVGYTKNGSEGKVNDKQGSKGKTYRNTEGIGKQKSNHDTRTAGETREDKHLQSIPGGNEEAQRSEKAERNRRLKENAVSPKKNSVAEKLYLQAVEEYGIEPIVVSDSAWVEYRGENAPPMMCSEGEIYIQESISDEYLNIGVPHEATHLMRQLGFKPYFDFVEKTSDFINFSSEDAKTFIEIVAKHCGLSNDVLVDGTDAEISKFFDELNSTIYGYYEAGITSGKLDDGKTLDLKKVFHNFDEYIAELLDIHEQFKSRKNSVKKKAVSEQEVENDVERTEQGRDEGSVDGNHSREQGSSAEKRGGDVRKMQESHPVDNNMQSVSRADSDGNFGSIQDLQGVSGKVNIAISGQHEQALTKNQKINLQATKKLSALLGLDITVYESEVGKNGKRVGANGIYRREDGTIAIDLYAGDNGQGAMVYTLAHELAHFIKQWSPEQFKKLADFLVEQYHEKGVSVIELVRLQQKKNPELSFEEAFEEMVADSCETFLTDSDIFEKLELLRVKHKPLYQKIGEKIRSFMKKLRKAYATMEPDSREGKIVRGMTEVLTPLHDIFYEGLVEASDNYRAAKERTGAVEINNTTTEDSVKHSQRNIIGESGKNYGVGVCLDSNLLTGLTEVERKQMVREFVVSELAGRRFIAYDNNNNAVNVGIANKSDTIKNQNGEKRQVLKELYNKYNGLIIKQEAVVLIDELIANAKYDSSSSPKYSHGWLDNHGKNDWDYWKVFIQENNKTVWEATLNIANTSNGEKILYDIGPIKIVEEAIKSAPTSTTNNIPQDSVKSQDFFSLRNSDGGISSRYLLANALESTAITDLEKKKIAEYKAKIAEYSQEQRKLQELNAEIKELSFAKGKRDTARLKELKEEAAKTANRINIYDSQLLRLEATNSLKDVLSREKEKAVRKQKAKDKAVLKEVVSKERAKQEDIIKKYQESRKKGIEGRRRTELKNKVKRTIAELNSLLLNGTKERNVKIELQNTVATLLDAIDMNTDRLSEKARRRLQDLSAAYKEIIEDSKTAHDANIQARIDKMISDIGDTRLIDMTFEQLEDVYETCQMVLTAVRDANKLFKEGRTAYVSETSQKVIKELHNVGRKSKESRLDSVEKGQGFAFWGMLNPVYAFEYMGSDTLLNLYHELRNGEDVMARDLERARRKMDSLKEKYGHKNWKLNEEYSFIMSNGDEFVMTLGHIMSVYAYTKREQAKKHIENGGFYIEKVKRGGVTENQYKTTGATASFEVEEKMVSKLSDKQKAYVDEMVQYLSADLSRDGNEVSRQLYGIDIFKEKFYFPLKTKPEMTVQGSKEAKATVSLKNVGMAQQTVPGASNPIVLESFDDVWAGHCSTMASYHAFVLPIENINRVVGYIDRESGSSVQTVLQSYFGKNATDYIEKLIADVNGQKESSETTISEKALTVTKKVAVAASLSTVVQQPTAIIRAMAYINPGYFVHVPNVPVYKHKETWEEEKKYAPVAIIKEMGGFDIGGGRKNVDYILNSPSVMQRVDDYGMFLASYADEYGWNTIWNAVKREVKTKTNLKDGSKEFFEACGKRFTEVIEKTQVYDSVFARSQHMRREGLGWKMATSFMGEPTKTLNMLFNATVMLKRGKISSATAFRIVTSVVISTAVASALASAVYAARDDDEDETYWEKYIEALVGSLIDNFNPLSYFPWLRDAWSVSTGFTSQTPEMEIWTDISDAITKVFDEPNLENVEKTVASISKALGIPIKNLLREAKAVYNVFVTFGNGETNTMKGAMYSAKSALPFSSEVSKSKQLYEAIVTGDKAHEKRVRGWYSDNKKANNDLKQELRANDSRIWKTAQLIIDRRYGSIKSSISEIVSEGHFSEQFVTEAVYAEAESFENKVEKAAEAFTLGDKDTYQKIVKEFKTEYKDAFESSSAAQDYFIAAMNQKIAEEKAGSEEKVQNSTSIYKVYQISDAFETGDTELALEMMDDIIKVKTENYITAGYSEKEADKKARSSVRSSMTSYWKDEYREAWKASDKDRQQEIRDILINSGLYGKRSDVLDTLKDWRKE